MNSRIGRTILGIKTGRQLALAMKFEFSMFLPSRVPHNVSARDTVLGSAYSNLECYLVRLRITLNRSIRQQEDILSPGFPLSTRRSIAWRTTTKPAPQLWNLPRIRIVSSNSGLVKLPNCP